MMRSQASSHRKPMNVVRIMKTPIRAVSKALDLYVKGVTNFATTYNTPVRTMDVNPNCQQQQQQLPRSFSTSRVPSDHDQPPPGALVRSISTAATDSRAANLESYMRQHYRHQVLRSSASSRKGVARSCSVGMGRIDEDRVSSFEEDGLLLKSKLIPVKNQDSLFSRSRSTYDRLSTKSR